MVIEGKAVQLRREHNGRAWLAYFTAALPRARQPISLRRLQVPEDLTPRQQTPDHQFAIFKALAEASKVLRKH